MSRTQGAKNKVKTVAELVKMLQSAADAEGVSLSDIMANKAATEAENESGGDAEKAAELAKEKAAKFQSLEIEIPDTDIDTYKCGHCNAIMPSALPKCQDCGADLIW